MQTIADLMAPPPTQWGLRGDPVLWHDLAARFADCPLPETRVTLAAELDDAIQSHTGMRLSALPDRHYCKALDHHNGGMSRGQISGPFWRDTALPLILARFQARSR